MAYTLRIGKLNELVWHAVDDGRPLVVTQIDVTASDITDRYMDSLYILIFFTHLTFFVIISIFLCLCLLCSFKFDYFAVFPVGCTCMTNRGFYILICLF